MCGIAGIVDLSGRLDRQTLADLAGRMAGQLVHRGPDDGGVWVDPTGTCALSQRRLSILDLSPAGHQPMIHKETGTAISFNGEIYNYRTLRADMEKDGIAFSSGSDTEVLLNGLVNVGSSFINRLDGMFAFGFFNPQTRTLTLARDLFGEKPLYYAQTPDWFAFASELHALALLPGFDNGISLDRLATYMALQYLPAPQTIYHGANKLKPGHILTLTLNGTVHIERFATFVASSAQTGTRSMDDLADELEDILSETIRTRLVADVPLGAFLSGGVDSATVVALARKHVSHPIRTFSIGFENSPESEHELARETASLLETQHTDQILTLDALDLGKHIATVLDEPNGDTSCLPTWELSRMTRQHVTVALSGDGGDELFGGYGRYQRTLQDSLAGGDDWEAGATYYSPRMMIFQDAALEKFLGEIPPETRGILTNLRRRLDGGTRPLLARLRDSDIENYLPGAVLAKVDRMSMQHALEVRAPLLGRKVADFAMQMAADDLCSVAQTKRVLKHLAARYLPHAWLQRPKMGFGLPVKGWGGPELAQAVTYLLRDPASKLGQWIDAMRLERFLAYHAQTPLAYQLWNIYLLELWLRSHPHTVK